VKKRTSLLIAVAIATASPFGGASAQTTTDALHDGLARLDDAASSSRSQVR
jgi:hypothetical protein